MSKATVYAVYHSKGGVGKTTTTRYLAEHLAGMGQRVLAIDMDPQFGLTKMVKTGSNGQYQPYTICHVLGGAVAPTATLRTTARPTELNFEIVPSHLDLANVLTGLKNRLFGRLEALHSAIEKEGHRWDVILVDCPPDVDILPANALMAADGVIIPCEPEQLPIVGLVEVAGMLAQVEAARGRTFRREYVVTKLDTRNKQHQRGLEALRKKGAVVRIPDRKGKDAEAQLLEAYKPLAERLLAAQGVDDA